MDGATLNNLIERIVASFPPGRAGCVSREQRDVRLYLYAEVYGRTRTQLRRQFGLSAGEYRDAMRAGQKLVRDAGASDLSPARVRAMALSASAHQVQW